MADATVENTTQLEALGEAYEGVGKAIKNALQEQNAQNCFYKITIDEILCCII